MKINKTLVSVESWVLSLHDPVLQWAVLMDIAYKQKISQEEALEVVNGIFEKYYHCRKYTDVRSLRRAAMQKQSNKVLQTARTKGRKFVRNSKIMTPEEIEKIVFDPDSNGFEMTAEIAEYLGLSEQWKIYEEVKKQPSIQMSQEEFEAIRQAGLDQERSKYPDHEPPMTREQWQALKFKCEGPND